MISTHKQADELLKELNLNHVEGAEREKVLETLTKRFDDVMMNTVLSQLSGEQFEAFKKAIQSNNAEEEIAVITAQVPGLAQMIEERVLQEYNLMKSVMAE